MRIIYITYSPWVYSESKDEKEELASEDNP